MVGFVWLVWFGVNSTCQLKARFNSKRNLRATSVYFDTCRSATHGKQFTDTGTKKFEWQVSHDMLLDQLANQHDKVHRRKWRIIAHAWAEHAHQLGVREVKCVLLPAGCCC